VVGAEVNRPKDHGYVALHRVQDAATAKVLIEAGADVQAKDHRGWTPLMWAAYYGKPDVVRLLIAHHASVNDTASGQTALGIATAGSRQDIARILREAGAREAP
jgi:ankyrin repeat protein